MSAEALGNFSDEDVAERFINAAHAWGAACEAGDVRCAGKMVYRLEALSDDSRIYPDQIESQANKVRIPYWAHRAISDWYSKFNPELNQSPRDYLREKSWNEQYRFGLDALRKFGVLK